MTNSPRAAPPGAAQHSTASHTTLSRGTFTRMVSVLTVVQAVGTMTPLVIPAIAPAVAEGYGVPAYMIGYQSSLMYVGMVLSMMSGTNLTLRWGAARAMQFGLLLVALSSAAIAVGSVALLVPASMVMGVGYGLLTPAGSHVLLRFTPTGIRNLIFSIKQSGVPLGVVVAALLGPAIAVRFGWQAALLACAGVSMAMIALLQPWRAMIDDERDPGVALIANPVGPVRVMWGTKPLRYLVLAASLLAWSQVCQHSFTVNLFFDDLKFPLVEAGYMLMVAQLGGFVGRPFWGWVADRMRDSRRTMTVLVVILASAEIATATLGSGWPVAAMVLLFFVFGATASGWHGAFLAEIARLSPAGRVASSTGGSLVLTNANSVIAPLVFANVFVGLNSYALTFGLLAVPSITALWLIQVSRRQH